MQHQTPDVPTPNRRKRLLGAVLASVAAAAALALGGRIASAEPMANPLAGLEPSESITGEVLEGKVVERLSAGSYAYLCLENEKGERVWTVITGRGPELSTPVRVRSFARKLDFYSPRLDRTFDELVFGVLSTQ